MSEIKTNKISPRKGTTTTIGDSGDSVTISSGTTTTNQGTISTAGITGGTINNTTGTISGLQQVINWQTGSIKTASFTAVAQEGYFLNTTSGEITVTLPASPSAGDAIAVKDYADTFDTNKAILNRNGNKIQGAANNFNITVEGTAAVFVYVDSTQGWKLVDQSKASNITEAATFINATGGTITTDGDFKVHTFTSPGTFCVASIGNPLGGPNSVDYLVVAGGAGGGAGSNKGVGGGGAGGHRTSFPSPAGTTPVTAQGYPITVGGGGAGGSGPWCAAITARGTSGSNSIFSTITSSGGGGGGASDGNQPGLSGGSGGGGGSNYHTAIPSSVKGTGGGGNSPPVSPPQGNGGGNAAGGIASHAAGGGGGGAGGPGANATGSCNTAQAGDGGNGTPNSITGSAVTRAGGGGGAAGDSAPKRSGAGGPGGGGAGAPSTNGGASGTANTGGGGGAGHGPCGGGSGGSGVVIIRYKFQ